MEKILITGISGQDGIFLSNLLDKKGVEILGVSRLLNKTDIEKKFKIVNLKYPNSLSIINTDLRSYKDTYKLLSEYKPNKIFNLTGPSSVYDSFLDNNIPNSILKIFDNITKSLINQKNFPTFIQASSSEMFGKQVNKSPLTEDSTFNPKSPYAISKFENHKKVKELNIKYDWNISSAILFNHDSELRPKNFLLKKIITTCIKIKNGEVNHLEVGSTDYVRDWSYAGDIAKSLKILSENQLDSSYVIGSGVGTSIRKVIEIVFEYIGVDQEDKVKINSELLRKNDPNYIVSNPNKIEREFGWKTEEKIDYWLKKLIDYEIKFQNLR